MPIVKAFRRSLKCLYGVAFALYLSTPVFAFTPSQGPLLSASAVTPNVMLLVDNSGSMDSILYDAGFNPDLNWPSVYRVQSSCSYYSGCTYSKGSQISNGTSDYVFVGNLSKTGCASGYGFYQGGVICLVLADPAGGGTTRYPIDYLSYLVGQVSLGKSVASIPTESRIRTAISVAQSLVDANRSLRIGLSTFNPPKTGDSGPGGNIKQSIADLSPVTALGNRAAVTQATADSNYTALSNAISALNAEANTPLAETYYQVTRYFRGLAPSPSYTGSPTTYTSPIQYRCQKNYGVVITDGLPTYDRTFPSNDPDDPKSLLPNWDQSATDGNNLSGDGEGDTLYLDDIAKFAYDIDMRKDTSTPALDLSGKSWDTAGFKQQNLSTYTVGFTASNLMLSMAASYGHGIYYQANDKASLNAALSGALSDINAKAGSGGGGASNSATLQTGARFYQTLYDPTDWHGTVKAFDLSSTGTFDINNPAWSTDTTIVSSATAPTFQSWSTASTGSAITLDYLNFSPAQQTVLNANLPAGITGIDLIAWTKGTNKTGLRARTRLLGDIINSPLAAALPSDQTATDLVGDTSYTTYLAAKKSGMNSNFLVNANDGFMHVINPGDGTRRYAYMPSTVLPLLSTVASTTYGAGMHKFTVDGQISVFDTQLIKGGTWQTVALGGVGAGGKAYYAIQLFEGGGSSNTISALWEVKAPDTNTPANLYNDLGYAYSKPAVARLADGTGIMIIGNGYGSFTGKAALYVLNIKTGAVIREISITPATGETDNGLSSVKLRVNAQNIVQAAYAGDLKGHMWKFDLSDASPANWALAFAGKPLFTTPRGALQPITVQPLLLDHPTNGKIVYFGTGKFSETTDKQTTDLQDFYAVWDADGGTGGYVEANLQPQSISGSITSNGSQYFTTTENDVDWTTKKGWYLPLSVSGQYLGERIIYPAQTSRGRIIFTTAAVNSTDPCESTGTGRLFELDAIKGGMLSYAVLDTSGDGVVDATDTRVSGLAFGSGLPNLASIVSGSSGTPDNKYVPDSSGNIIKLIEKGGDASIYQRIMWRQIQ